jgi:lysophospholipase L1-like esterase
MVMIGLVLVGALAMAPVAFGWAQPMPRYYLSLGDSLSQGVQPNVSGRSVETNQGYPDQLYASLRARIRNLKLVKLGCPGETTTSMLTGKGNEKNARMFRCARSGGSQLSAAKRFLRAHHRRGEVVLVTIDIGANDVDSCANPGVNLGQCVSTGEAAIGSGVPQILKAIKQAAPPGTRLAGMTLYDPVLSNYFSTVPSQQQLATVSTAVLKQINDTLTAADTAAGFRTADVAGAFASYDSTTTVTYLGRSIPVNVARVCSWTWNCATPPSGPNIHANKNGYAVIAGAFERVIGRLG